jgi:hypothetical protein
MKCLTVPVAVFLALCLATAAFAAGVPDGYAGLKWGTDLQTVKKLYPKGQVGQQHTETAYKQESPNADMASRTFLFKENKLIGASVKFNAEYVMKVGLDNLLAEHKKSYGEGKLDKSQGPHMVIYVWEGPRTRITYAYAPKRADMCIVLFQQK